MNVWNDMDWMSKKKGDNPRKKGQKHVDLSYMKKVVL